MAIDFKWLYSTNPFITAAIESDENAMKQIFFHDAALKSYKDAYPSDTDYSAWYDRFHPLCTDTDTKYNGFYNIEDSQVSKTLGVDVSLKGIKGKEGKARDWYNRTAAIYATANPIRFKAIWTHGLKPFYKSGKDHIIGALKTLSLNIGGDENELMIAIKEEVDTAYTAIKGSRDTQKSAITTTGLTRTALNAAIKLALETQGGDLGLELNKFRSDPDRERKIKSFHDLETIQKRQQKLFNLTLNSPETKPVATRTLVFNSRLRVRVGGGNVKVYLATAEGGTDSTPVAINDGENRHFTAAEFGITAYGTHRYITVEAVSGSPISFLLQLY